MDRPITKRIAWCLVALAFLSKISFSFTGLVPTELGFVLFQGGIHPYLNVLLNFTLGGFLFWGLRSELPTLRNFHFLYRWFVVGTVAILWVQHFLQLATGSDASVALVLITLLSATFLIYTFGIALPQIIPADEFVSGVAKICLGLCLVSLLFYFAGLPALWKGSRFVGVFKHIPYMVTCASVGFLWNLHRWRVSLSWKKHILFFLCQLAIFYCLILTGTRSALFAILLGSFLFFLCFDSKSVKFRMLRILAVWLVSIAAILFGSMAYEFASDLATGKTSIGERAPQDGVGDRTEEVYRGLEMLQQSPHLGLGLLSKFSSAEGEEVVDSYNSFQDPHNLFISSAVVAGWPFGLWVFLGFLCLTLGSALAVLERSPPGLVIGIYLLSHLPILSIYHMHLSLGGLADRLYWLSFGYLAWLRLNPFKRLKTV